MGYQKHFSLKSHDYMQDHRDDELVFEFHEGQAFTIATNTADAEVPTRLDEVLGVISLGMMSVFAAGDNLSSISTDGVITTGAVTVRVVTASVGDGAFSTSFFLVGKKKLIDPA